MTKEELENKAREYLAEHSEYSEVFGQTFVAVDTLTAMVDFAEPREKQIAELKDDNKVMADNYSKMEQKFFDNLTKAKELLKRYVPYRQITDSKAYKDLAEETEQFLNSEVEK